MIGDLTLIKVFASIAGRGVARSGSWGADLRGAPGAGLGSRGTRWGWVRARVWPVLRRKDVVSFKKKKFQNKSRPSSLLTASTAGARGFRRSRAQGGSGGSGGSRGLSGSIKVAFAGMGGPRPLWAWLVYATDCGVNLICPFCNFQMSDGFVF